MTLTEAKAKFSAKINALTPEQLEAGLVHLTMIQKNRGGKLSEEERLVRAAMLERYGELFSVEAEDALMDKLDSMLSE